MRPATALVLGAAVIAWAVMPRTKPDRPEPKMEEPPAPGVQPAWPPAWQVLVPRHRITSPAPLIAFWTPGWLGPVEVRVETPRGVHATVTRARGLSWPASLPTLARGEWCAVSILGPRGRAAEAACLRVSCAALDADAGEPDLLSLGLPAPACLRGGPDLGVARLRAGLDPVPPPGPSATMNCAGER